MTLIIAYLLMSQANVHWIWYPVVFVVWIFHLIAMSNDGIKVTRK